MYQVKPQFLGNPDKGQDPYTSPYGIKPKTFSAESLDLLKHQIYEFMTDNGLGASNWNIAKVYKDNKPYGYMSYNGRIWDRSIWDIKAKEIKEDICQQ
jgi:hypothetical protein